MEAGLLHPGHGQREVWELARFNRPGQWVISGLHGHQFVLQDLVRLPRQERSARLEPAVEVHGGLFTHLEGGSVCQQTQFFAVLFARDQNLPIFHNRVAKPVGPGKAQDVRSPFVVLNHHGDPGLAGLLIGFYRESFHLPLDHPAALLHPLEHSEGQALAAWLTECVCGGDFERERLTIQVYITGGSQGDPERPDGQRGPRLCGHTVLWQRGRNGQHLLFGQPFGGELECKYTFLAGLPAQGAAVW